jgi:hypothetical protein
VEGVAGYLKWNSVLNLQLVGLELPSAEVAAASVPLNQVRSLLLRKAAAPVRVTSDSKVLDEVRGHPSPITCSAGLRLQGEAEFP